MRVLVPLDLLQIPFKETTTVCKHSPKLQKALNSMQRCRQLECFNKTAKHKETI